MHSNLRTLKGRVEEKTYGVIGIELRIREPSAEGVAPLREEAADLSAGDEEEACRAGVSRTSLRNWELFILSVDAGCSRIEDEDGGMFSQDSSLAGTF
jgi:hypothetical protein